MKKTIYVYRISSDVMESCDYYMETPIVDFPLWKGVIWLDGRWWAMESYDDLVAWLDATHANIIITDDDSHPDDWWEKRCGDGRYTFEFVNFMKELELKQGCPTIKPKCGLNYEGVYDPEADYEYLYKYLEAYNDYLTI